MFTGIIENTGIIKDIQSDGSNEIFWVASPLSPELKVDQSLSHNGVCLTVEAIKEDMHRITAIEETLKKTNLNTWEVGNIINLERCMLMNGRIDGHIVQGHVDCTAKCIDVLEKSGSREFSFTFQNEYAKLIIEKGSITVNGISLTCFNITDNTFTVAIIPYTFENTNMKMLKKGNLVNLEFDMIGKYIARIEYLK